MKKPRAHVSDHAVLRYLQRVHGVDIEGLRRRIGRVADLAVEHNASSVLVGGHRYLVRDGVVVTVEPHRQRRFGPRRSKTKSRKS